MTAFAAILAFVAVICIGGSVQGERARRKRRIQQLLDPDSPPTFRDAADSSGLLEKVGKAVSSGKTSPDLRQRLVRAGYYDRKASQIFLGAKMLLLVLSLGVSLVLVVPMQAALMTKLSIGMVAVGSVFFLPDIVLRSRTKKRQNRMHSNLPDVVDLMEICVSSGMAMDMAWNLVADEIRAVDIDLADEMALTDLEVHLGFSRVDAMRHMAERTDAQELRSLVSTLVQAERFGTSIADALQTFASDMRSSRSAHAEEACEKLTVKLLLPMILFIFPAFLVVIMGPAAIRFYDMIGQG